MQPMVSIIVPIYNAEQYLRRCVDSILNQEYTDYELLLVNDGSTDASGDICEEYGDGEIDACAVLYNQFHSAISQEVRIDSLLPLKPLSVLFRKGIPHPRRLLCRFRLKRCYGLF